MFQSLSPDVSRSASNARGYRLSHPLVSPGTTFLAEVRKTTCDPLREMNISMPRPLPHPLVTVLLIIRGGVGGLIATGIY